MHNCLYALDDDGALESDGGGGYLFTICILTNTRDIVPYDETR